MAEQNSCPPHCQVKLAAIEARMDKAENKLSAHTKAISDTHDRCRDVLAKDHARLEEELAKRPKTTVMISLLIILIGVVSGLFSAIWVQDLKMTAKIDSIAHKQIEVMTTMRLHLKEAEKIMEYHELYPAERDDGSKHP